MPESFTEVEISAGKKPIQKLRLLFAFFGYPPRKFTMAYPHTVLAAILDPLKYRQSRGHVSPRLAPPLRLRSTTCCGAECDTMTPMLC